MLGVFVLRVSNCSSLALPVLLCGLWGGGALCQKRNTDLCCCFSCFDAGPERAVHTTRDGPPGPRQPDPSRREKRCVLVSGQRLSPLPVWPSSLSVCRLLPTICLPLSRQRFASVDVRTCGSSQALAQAPLQLLRRSPWIFCRFNEPSSRTVGHAESSAQWLTPCSNK